MVGVALSTTSVPKAPEWQLPLPVKYDHGTMTIVIKEFQMKKMAAGAFKANCLAVMDEVQSKRITVVITKHGKPVAKLVPTNTDKDKDEIFGFLAGKATITGDIVSPALTPEEWGELY
jgi:prevent-host-death family protein